MKVQLVAKLFFAAMLCGCVAEKSVVNLRHSPPPYRSVPSFRECPDVKIQFENTSFVVDIPDNGRDMASHLMGSNLIWGEEGVFPKDVLVTTSTVPKGPRRTTLVLISFTGPVCSEQALRLIRVAKHRPATAEEFVAFLKKNPSYPREREPIAALGTLWGGGEKKRLALFAYRSSWEEYKWRRVRGAGDAAEWDEHEIFHDERIIYRGSTECGWSAGTYFLAVPPP